MTTLDKVGFDEMSFMHDPHKWDSDVGEAIAESPGLVGLDFDRVRVLEFLREHYLFKGAVPPAEEVCPSTDLVQHCIRGDLFESYENAWKVADLPDPGMSLRELMEDAG